MNRITPHGPGFSFIDTVESIDDTKLRGRKYLDPGMPFFEDHFPGEPLMPGVLLVEACAQTCGALWGRRHGGAEMERYALAQVGEFRFREPVLPGAELVIDVELEKDFGSLARFKAAVRVDERVAAQGVLTLARAGDKV